LQQLDKEWLDAVTKSDAKKMRELMDIFEKKNSSLLEKEVALELFEFYAEFIDNANDMNHPTVNALKPLLDCIVDEEVEYSIRLRCLSILGVALQENVKVQTQIVEYDGINKIFYALKVELSQLEKLKYANLEVIAKIISFFVCIFATF